MTNRILIAIGSCGVKLVWPYRRVGDILRHDYVLSYVYTSEFYLPLSLVAHAFFSGVSGFKFVCRCGRYTEPGTPLRLQPGQRSGKPGANRRRFRPPRRHRPVMNLRQGNRVQATFERRYTYRDTGHRQEKKHPFVQDDLGPPGAKQTVVYMWDDSLIILSVNISRNPHQTGLICFPIRTLDQREANPFCGLELAARYQVPHWVPSAYAALCSGLGRSARTKAGSSVGRNLCSTPPREHWS